MYCVRSPERSQDESDDAVREYLVGTLIADSEINLTESRIIEAVDLVVDVEFTDYGAARKVIGE